MTSHMQRGQGSGHVTAVGYVRVSTEEQAREGISLGAQQERIHAYCQMQGLTLAHLYRDEGVSAGKKLTDRPEGHELLEAVRNGTAHHVVALKLDRLFRDAIDCLQTSGDWDRAGISLHLIDLGGQAVNTGTAMGRFFLTVMAGAAEMERNLIRERTATALQHMKRQGQRLGQPPLGFATRNAGGLDDVLAGEMEAVRYVIERRRHAHVAFRTIAAELRALGHTTKRGGKWHASTVRSIWQRRKEYEEVLSQPA